MARHGLNRLLPALILLLASGCAGDRVRSIRPEAASTATAESPERPVAYWKRVGEAGRGVAVRPRDLDPVLVEIAGRRALQERLLDELLRQELRRSGLVLRADAELREEAILLAALDNDQDRARRLLEEVRAREGLGPVRFAGLLRRNAMLRRLIEDEVTITEDALLAAWDRAHGPRREARVIVVPTLLETTSILESLAEGVDFAALAAARSTDASASAGGLVEPVARLDPSWPPAFRDTLWALEPGTVSSPVLVGDDYLIIECLGERPGDDTTPEEARVESERVVRRGQERLLMDATARRLLGEVRVEFIDEGLGRAWDGAGEDLR